MLLKISLKFFVFIFLFNFCATFELTSREKTYGGAALGFTSGAVYGLTRKQAKGKNALFFGSLIGLLTSLIGIAIFNEEKKVRELEDKLSSLEEDLGLMYDGWKLLYSQSHYRRAYGRVFL